MDKSFKVVPGQLFELTNCITQRGLLFDKSTVLFIQNRPDPFSFGFDIELTATSERQPGYLHFLIRFKVLIADDVLKSSIVSLIF